jgi:hypothetical protein
VFLGDAANTANAAALTNIMLSYPANTVPPYPLLFFFCNIPKYAFNDIFYFSYLNTYLDSIVYISECVCVCNYVYMYLYAYE